MPIGKTYVKIATTTISSASSAVTFSNLPQNYTDLYLVLSVRANSAPTSFGTGIRFNGDTGSNYSRTYTYGYGPSTGGGREVNQTRIFYSSGTNTASQFNLIKIHLLNYSNSIAYKTVVARNDDKADVTGMTSGVWRNSSAITSITITPYDDNSTGFAVGTTFNIYGIECAKSPYAEGGDKVYSTGTHWVHEFYNSGTFVPRQNLTCDYLVVAGGGAGGHSGGGGAGGFRTLTSQSLTSQSYAVTVGAGGSRYIYNPNTPGSNGSDSTFNGLTSTGGGRGSTGIYAASNGGSGGGGGSTAYGAGYTAAGTSSPITSPVQGYSGGVGGGGLGGGGGGGAGGAGTAVLVLHHLSQVPLLPMLVVAAAAVMEQREQAVLVVEVLVPLVITTQHQEPQTLVAVVVGQEYLLVQPILV
jgi:hypothetical protein